MWPSDRNLAPSELSICSRAQRRASSWSSIPHRLRISSAPLVAPSYGLLSRSQALVEKHALQLQWLGSRNRFLGRADGEKLDRGPYFCGSVAADLPSARRTFAPVLLACRAQHRRHLTGDLHFRAALETQPTLAKWLSAAFQRISHMLTRENIVGLLGSWIVLEYLVVFGFLQGFAAIFGQAYEFSVA